MLPQKSDNGDMQLGSWQSKDDGDCVVVSREKDRTKRSHEDGQTTSLQ